MEDKFFLHRIRKEGDTYTTGIEVHDTLDSAKRSFHSQMKMAYHNPAYPNIKFVSCMVTDENDEVVKGYNESWSSEKIDDNFVHYIRHDGDTYTKGIEVQSEYSAACRSFHTHMEYGYGNSKFPNITLVACKITGPSGLAYESEVWTA